MIKTAKERVEVWRFRGCDDAQRINELRHFDVWAFKNLPGINAKSMCRAHKRRARY